MILDEIVKHTKIRVEQEKSILSLEMIKGIAFAQSKQAKTFIFEDAIKKEEISFICEVKKASPSKGIIAEEFPYIRIAKEYEEAGADCVSVLTEPNYFLGSDAYFKEIREEIQIPMLRKDFIIDEYQIYQSKAMGADCVLLICSLFTAEELKNYIQLCRFLGLSVLVEAHNEQEIENAVSAGARIIGVNNRDLKTFHVDISNSKRLRSLVPDGILFVAESGIETNADIEVLKEINVDAVLVGETLMKSTAKKAMLCTLKGDKKVTVHEN